MCGVCGSGFWVLTGHRGRFGSGLWVDTWAWAAKRGEWKNGREGSRVKGTGEKLRNRGTNSTMEQQDKLDYPLGHATTGTRERK